MHIDLWGCVCVVCEVGHSFIVSIGWMPNRVNFYKASYHLTLLAVFYYIALETLPKREIFKKKRDLVGCFVVFKYSLSHQTDSIITKGVELKDIKITYCRFQIFETYSHHHEVRACRLLRGLPALYPLSASYISTKDTTLNSLKTPPACPWKKQHTEVRAWDIFKKYGNCLQGVGWAAKVKASEFLISIASLSLVRTKTLDFNLPVSITDYI